MEISQHEMRLTLGWGALSALVTTDTEAREGGLILVHISKVKAAVTEMHFLLFSSGLQHVDRMVPLTCGIGYPTSINLI